MNAAHVHLILNHIPLIGIGFTLLLLLIALIRRSRELLNISLVLAVLVALIAIPVYLTGEPAEELVEDVPGVSELIMEQHEKSAEISFILMEVTGALALISIIVLAYSEKFGRRLCTLTLLMLVISGGFMVWTANLGGKINHPEIRSGSYNQGSQDTEYYEREDDD